MSRRLRLITIIAYAVLLAGLVLVDGAVLALVIPFVIYLGAALVYEPKIPTITATRRLSQDHVTQDLAVTMVLSLTNDGSPFEEVLVEDYLPSGVELISGSRKALVALEPGKKFELDYVIRARRGVYFFNDFRITSWDYLELSSKSIQLKAPTYLTVVPEVQKLHSISIRPLRTHGFSGPIPSRKVGSGTKFLDIRPYQYGDSLRSINWRVSARHGDELFTNEFEQDRITDIGLVLDARQESDPIRSGSSLFDYSVMAAASLAESFLDEGNRVGLLIYGRGMDYTFPGYGKIQRQKILKSLARAETGSTYAFKSLENLPTRSFPVRSQIVLISPIDPDDLPVLTQLRAQGYEVLLICPDSISFEAKKYTSSKSVQFSVRIGRVEQAMLYRRLKRLGITVVDWQVDQSLDKAIHRVVSDSLIRPYYQKP